MILIKPDYVNFIALLRRLYKICLSLRLSELIIKLLFISLFSTNKSIFFMDV